MLHKGSVARRRECRIQIMVHCECVCARVCEFLSLCVNICVCYPIRRASFGPARMRFLFVSTCVCMCLSVYKYACVYACARVCLPPSLCYAAPPPAQPLRSSSLQNVYVCVFCVCACCVCVARTCICVCVFVHVCMWRAHMCVWLAHVFVPIAP